MVAGDEAYEQRDRERAADRGERHGAARPAGQGDRGDGGRAGAEADPDHVGLASGLRSVVWKIAPPTPKARPTSTASTARGSLDSITM